MTLASKTLSAVMMALFLSGYNYVHASQLLVHINNPPNNGSVAFMLFDSANSFGDLRDPAILVKYPLDGRDQFAIENIPPDEYALLVYHDENNNNRIDKNFIGIPKESVGFSNGYQPKGPPNYQRAVFTLDKGETGTIDIKLARPLGKFGRIGIGVGLIARTSPYVDYDGAVTQLIPAITYNGERLQVYGPNIQLGLVGSSKLRLAVTASYRIGAYNQNDSQILKGMGDRSNTFMVGPAIQAELISGLQLLASYEHDVLDKIGGGESHLKLDKSFQFGMLKLTPGIALNWMSSDLANHDFGVLAYQATHERPAYALEDIYSFELKMGAFIELSPDWLFVLDVAAEILPKEVADSPIVSKDYIIKGFAVINYVF